MNYISMNSINLAKTHLCGKITQVIQSVFLPIVDSLISTAMETGKTSNKVINVKKLYLTCVCILMKYLHLQMSKQLLMKMFQVVHIFIIYSSLFNLFPFYLTFQPLV